MEKAGRWKKLEKVENVNGRKWKRKKLEKEKLEKEKAGKGRKWKNKSVDIVPG